MRNTYHIKEDKKAFLYPREFKQLFNTLSEKQQPYFKLAINTGGRIEEIRHVTPADINTTRKQLTFRITKVRAKLGEARPTPRTIQVSSEFVAWMLRYAKRNNIKDDQPFVTYSTAGINKIIELKVQQLGRKDFKDFSSHNLRKTHGQWLLALNISGIEVAMRLGHDIDTLTECYASPTLFNAEDKILICDELGDLYKDIRRV